MIKDTFDEATLKMLFDMIKEEQDTNETFIKYVECDTVKYCEMRMLELEVDKKFIFEGKTNVIIGIEPMTEYVYFKRAGLRSILYSPIGKFKVGCDMDIHSNLILNLKTK